VHMNDGMEYERGHCRMGEVTRAYRRAAQF
jgi:hypothetical protein